jgi:hypothetical protein
MLPLSLDWLGALHELQPLPWPDTTQAALLAEVTVLPTVTMLCHLEEALSALHLDTALALLALYIVLKVARYPAVKSGKSVELPLLPDKKSIRMEDPYLRSSRRVSTTSISAALWD